MRVRWIAIALFASAFAIRVVLAAILPLAPDEAYYWSWSTQPAISYWDQPAGSAFFLGTADRWFGHSEFAVRLFPIIGSLVSALLILMILRELLEFDTALLSVALSLFTPLTFGETLAVHDSFMIPFWTMALFAAHKLRTQPKKFTWWLLLAGFWALAVYAKLSALLFGLGIAVYLAGAKRFKDWLLNPRAWVAALVFIVLLLPILAWNLAYHGVMFLAVKRLTLVNPVHGPFSIASSILDLLMSQAMLITPGLFLLILLAMAAAPISYKRERDDAAWFLFSFSAPILLYFLWLSTRTKVQGNWPSPTYVAAIPLAVWYVSRMWQRKGVRALAKASVALCAAEFVLIGAHLAYPVVKVPNDPTLQMWGWRELASRVEAEAETCKASFVMTRKYQIASELMFYLKRPLPVLCANFSGRGNQFDLWNDFAMVAGSNAIVVDTSKVPQTMFLHFESYEKLQAEQPQRNRLHTHTFRLYCAKSFQVAGPHELYFRDPFGYSLRRLQTFIEVKGK